MTLFSGFLVYFAATIIAFYSEQNQFFSCDLTTIVPRNGPWEKLNQLSSIDTKAPKELFSREYLFDENLWMTLGKIFKLLYLKCSCTCIANLCMYVTEATQFCVTAGSTLKTTIKDGFKGNDSLISWMLAPLGCFNRRLDRLNQSFIDIFHNSFTWQTNCQNLSLKLLHILINI